MSACRPLEDLIESRRLNVRRKCLQCHNRFSPVFQRKALLFVLGLATVLFVWIHLKPEKSASTFPQLKIPLTDVETSRVDVIRHVLNVVPRHQSGIIEQHGDQCCSFGSWLPSSSASQEKDAVSSFTRTMTTKKPLSYDLMDRDITYNEPWPAVEIDGNDSAGYPLALHYLWCGKNREFHFQHYLGLLSGMRVLKPLKIFFYFTVNPPVMDSLMYNSWFEEFKQGVPVMDMRHVQTTARCGSPEMLDIILELVAKDGGLYLGENIILAGLPNTILSLASWTAFADDQNDVTRGIIYVKHKSVSHFSSTFTSAKLLHGGSACVSPEEFDRSGGLGEGGRCVFVKDRPKYPRDIWAAETPFGELARWLYYGRRAAFEVQRDPSNPIPRISHYIRVQSNHKPMYQDEFSFNHFLSVLSSLYVAGFQRVYLHVDKEPTGKWWEALRKENITVLRLQKPDYVYQQQITSITHFSDVSRYNVLNRFGGAYQDFDCVWTTRVPDELLEYPTVVSPAISNNGQWPDGLAIGMLMARPRAPFLRHAFKGYRDYHGDNYLYNAIMRSYRTYEHYPDILRFDPHFTVFCIDRRCLPRWMRHSQWDLTKNGGRHYNWSTEALALHMPKPKPIPAFTSPHVLKHSHDMFGDVGRKVLRRSGRLYILDNL